MGHNQRTDARQATSARSIYIGRVLTSATRNTASRLFAELLASVEISFVIWRRKRIEFIIFPKAPSRKSARLAFELGR